ncbi:MAG TPA: signal peptidase I, partial [Myxococcota bacterium]
MSRLRRLLTVGHAIAAVVVLGGLYLVWGNVMPEGGTGSNVVLGLLVAIAAFWMGTTALGPTIDQALVPKDKAKDLIARQAAFDLARELQKAAKRERRNKKTKLTSDVFARVDAAVVALDRAAAGEIDVAEALKSSEGLVDEVFAPTKESTFAQVRSLGLAFAVAIALRTFAVAPFQIPSGSMIPTLLIGDHLFVWRATYGLQIPSENGLGRLSALLSFLPSNPFYFLRWSTPAPGDVVVFEAPPWVGQNSGEDWIKRVIAGPGQTVSFDGTVLTVDGREYKQTTPDGVSGLDEGGYPLGEMTRYGDYNEMANRWLTETGNHKIENLVERDGTVHPHSIFNDMPPHMVQWPTRGAPPSLNGLRCTDEACVVEDGYVFVMGDNRDHSSDGRFWGAVPIDNIKGKAIFIWVSVDGSENSLKLGRFTLPRFRMG